MESAVSSPVQGTSKPSGKGDALSQVEKTEPLRRLLLAKQEGTTVQELSDLGGPQLRDRLLYLDPLNVDWVKQVNKASTVTATPAVSHPLSA
jgi:hypothetical protein